LDGKRRRRRDAVEFRDAAIAVWIAGVIVKALALALSAIVISAHLRRVVPLVRSRPKFHTIVTKPLICEARGIPLIFYFTSATGRD
jgi:hypothetical protein